MAAVKLRTSITWLILATLLLVAYLLVYDNQQPETGEHIIGEVAEITLPQLGLSYLSRIDTGAATTSIHARDIHVANPAEHKKRNVGKPLTFTSSNEKGESSTFTAPIVRVSQIRNAQGIEYRYLVKLKVRWKDLEKEVEVNLRDRSKMAYKLLIGRNWLEDDVLVNVSQSEGPIND